MIFVPRGSLSDSDFKKLKSFVLTFCTAIVFAAAVMGFVVGIAEAQSDGTVLTVPRGGTGRATFPIGQFIVGNGTGALQPTTSPSVSGNFNVGQITATGIGTSTFPRLNVLSAFALGDDYITSLNGPGLAIENNALVVTLIGLDTGDLAEGSNLYFTDGRARSALSGGSGIIYSDSTGVIGCNTASASVFGCLSSADWTTFFNRFATTSTAYWFAQDGVELLDDRVAALLQSGSGITLNYNDAAGTLTISGSGGGGGGGSDVNWAFASNGLVHPATSTNAVVIGNTSTTTNSAKLEVTGGALFDTATTSGMHTFSGVMKIGSAASFDPSLPLFAFNEGTTTVRRSLQMGSTIRDVMFGGTAARSYSSSESVGGAWNLNMSTFGGAGLVLYNNASSTGSLTAGRLLSLICDNVGYDTNCFHVRSDSDTESAVNVFGQAKGKGIIKAAGGGPADADAAVLSLDASSNGFLGQGIYILASPTNYWLNVRKPDLSGTLARGFAGGGFGLGVDSMTGNAAFQVGTTFTVSTTSASSTLAAHLNARTASTTGLSAPYVCLGVDCRTAWPSSGNTVFGTSSSLVAGRTIVHPLNDATDILSLGSTATGTAEYYFDPNTNTAQLGRAGSGDSVIQLGATSNEWSMGFDETDKSFAISSSTALGTNNALTIDKLLKLTFANASSTTGISASYLCLGSDCRTTWPSGGGGGAGTFATTSSTVAGQNVNAPIEDTDILTIGDQSTTTAEFVFDPNTARASINGALEISGWTVSTTTTVCATGCEYTSLQTALDDGRKNIKVKSGTYALTAPIKIPGNDIMIEGEGDSTLFQFNRASVGLGLISSDPTASRIGITLQNFALQATGASTGGICIDFTGFEISQFRNVDCYTARIAYMASTSEASFYNIIDSPEISIDGGYGAATSSVGIYLGDGAANNTTIINPRIRPLSTMSSSTGIYVDSHSVTCVLCNVESDAKYGIYVTGEGSDFNANVYLEGNQTNLYFEPSTSDVGGYNITGTIADADTNAQNIVDNGAKGLQVNARVQYAAKNYYTGTVNGGLLGLGTTTPADVLHVADVAGPQITLSDTNAGTNLKHWTLSSDSGAFALATSSDALGAATPAAFSISSAGNSTLLGNLRTTAVGIGKAASSNTRIEAITSSTFTNAYRVESDAVSRHALTTFVTGDPQVRFVVRTDGNLAWGPGSATTDTSLIRSATATLQTSGAFVVGGALTGSSTVKFLALSAAAGTPNSVCIDATTKEVTENPALTCTVSSILFKTAVSVFEKSGIDTVLAMRPVQFAYKDAPDRVRWGFIAEEMAKIDMRLADGYKDGRPTSIDQNAILAAVVKAVQEIIHRQDKDEQRIEQLEKQVAELQEQLKEK